MELAPLGVAEVPSNRLGVVAQLLELVQFLEFLGGHGVIGIAPYPTAQALRLDDAQRSTRRAVPVACVRLDLGAAQLVLIVDG